MLCCSVITIKSNDDHLALRVGIKMKFNAHSCYKYQIKNIWNTQEPYIKSEC